MVVDGVPNQRACMLKITRPLMVAPQTASTAPFEAEGRAPVALDDYRVERPRSSWWAAGRGGWPAPWPRGGLAPRLCCWTSGARPGASTTSRWLWDRAGDPLDSQQAAGQRLVEAVARSASSWFRNARYGAAFPADDAAADILAIGSDGIRRVRPARLVVATGAYERALPVPGWTMPGVMTTRAAQTLWRSYRTLPGRRVLIAGNGPLNLQVACELARAGATVVAVAAGRQSSEGGSPRSSGGDGGCRSWSRVGRAGLPGWPCLAPGAAPVPTRRDPHRAGR